MRVQSGDPQPILSTFCRRRTHLKKTGPSKWVGSSVRMGIETGIECKIRNSTIVGGDSTYRTATATPASATGNDQAQSPSKETAAAATTQPTRKQKRSRRDLFNRPASTVISGRLGDDASINDSTVLVKLPVITAVEIAPGIAKRSRAY